MSPAPSASPVSSDRDTPLSPFWLTTAHAIRANCSTPNSCAPKICPCPNGLPRRRRCPKCRMSEMTTPALVSTEWLAANMWQPNVVVADASWYLPQAGRKARGEYDAAHIPGALFFDIDAISDQTTDLPHMLPDMIAFASNMRMLGIGDSVMVVFYDGAGIYSAPRALWMMRAMGHRNAAVLDGGFPKWRREARGVESIHSQPAARGHFTPRLQENMIRDFPAMQSNLQSRAEQIVDARSPTRFRGEEPEPRAGVKPGHIPGAANLYYAD